MIMVGRQVDDSQTCVNAACSSSLTSLTSLHPGDHLSIEMQLIHGSGYTNEEREAFKEIIFSNTVQSMRVIMDAMDTLNIALEKPENQKHREVILSLPSQIEADTFPADAAAAVKALWTDAGVKECVKRSREYQLNDSAR